jgi:hypothetical protein
MSIVSVILLSQLLEVVYNIIPSFTLFNPLLSGSNRLKGIKKIIMAKIAKGVLLLVSFISSDTLMLINIRMNKNKIETAPT